MFTFATPSPAGTSCQAHFYTWTQLSELCSALLTSFFERPTPCPGRRRNQPRQLELEVFGGPHIP